MLSIRWSSHTRQDFQRIADYWSDRDPDKLSDVLQAIRRRANWIADDHYMTGTIIGGLPREYRWHLERRYGYKVYYRVEGEPPETLSVIAVRHGRERPLKPSTVRKYDR